MTNITTTVLSLILVAGMSACAATQAVEPPLKVFVFAGTSNLCSGFSAELPDDLKQTQKDVLVYQGGRWVPLEPGGKAMPLPERFGPEVTFGQAMTKHLGEPIGIIMGGLIMVAPADHPETFTELINKVKEAQKSRPIVVAGMLIQAGERDGYTEEWAKAFQKNLTGLIERVRRDLGNAAMPIAINRAIPNSAAFPYVDEVRKTEASIDLPGFRVVDCDDVPRGGDKIHYTTKGQVELGKRYAAAMIELLKADKAEKKVDPTSAPAAK